MARPLSPVHRWYDAADCARILMAVRHGKGYRGPCPVHRGDSTTCLSITEGRDKYGHPRTYIKCFAHDCDIRLICIEMNIEYENLFCIRPEYAKETRYAPRARSPRIDRLKAMPEPSPDEIAQIMLEEMIVSDPDFINECEPARQKMWELAQANPATRAALTKALVHARLAPAPFWKALAAEMER